MSLLDKYFCKILENKFCFSIFYKLIPLKKRKRLEPINILVIRVSPKNKIQSSKPCINCLKIMNTLPEKKGYKIENVYYSNEEGNILKTTLKSLENEEKHYSKYYRRQLK